MHFTIIRDVQDKDGHIPGMGLMSVDNETIMLDASALDPTISIVTWAGNRGLIQYNDRPEVRRPVTDIAPYQPWVDRFMRVVADGEPQLTLEQAKQLKIDLVEALYDNKRKSPFPYAGREYECSDEAIAHMSSVLAVVTNDIATSGDPGMVNAVNGAFLSMAATINSTIVGGINSGVSIANANANAVNTWSGVHAHNWALTSNAGAMTLPGLPAMVMAYAGAPPNQNPGSGGMTHQGAVASISAPTVTWSPTTPANTVPWQPLDSDAVVNVPVVTFREALRGIVNRRNAINLARRNHKKEINLLNIVQTVIDYDTTTGWPP